jgi:membrane protease YdiL (CAAX protease family)
MFKTLFINHHRELRNGWWLLAFYVLLGIGIVACSVFWSGGQPLSETVQLLLVLLTTGTLQWMRRSSLSEISGPMNLHAARDFLIGAVVGAALMAIPALVLAGGGWVRFTPGAFNGSALLEGLRTAVTIALLEELIFRGFMFCRLRAGMGVPFALLITSAFFVLTHMGNPAMTSETKLLAGPNIFVASILFGLVRIRSGGLAMPVGLHMMANFMQGTILGFGVSGYGQAGLVIPIAGTTPEWLSGGAFGLEASLPGLLTVLAFTVAASVWRRQIVTLETAASVPTTETGALPKDVCNIVH